MAFWGKNKQAEPLVIVVSLAGREDLMPDFTYALGTEEKVVGRDSGCTIQIVDGEVSRRHVRIRYDAQRERHLAEDLGSANGTTINGFRINAEVPLSEGDRIEIGSSRLIYTQKRFKDHGTAMRHFKAEGQNVKGTYIKH